MPITDVKPVGAVVEWLSTPDLADNLHELADIANNIVYYHLREPLTETDLLNICLLIQFPGLEGKLQPDPLVKIAGGGHYSVALLAKEMDQVYAAWRLKHRKRLLDNCR